MAASNEWTEYHLTPSGWVTGTEKTDFRRDDVDPPQDRVLTIRYVETLNGYGGGSKGHHEVWRSAEDTSVNTLLAKYGQAPMSL